MDDNIHTNPEYQDGQKAADRRQGKETEHHITSAGKKGTVKVAELL